ncbi:hypothetical protein [uncultured Sunxiuqinia sp.]|jgi:hypothetical protein|uniref:hypothetical protein n=1 Tax=uncultured Sunxiuqinia sp. TaxID=1573825 RepID=UPI00198A6664|nr:hypothetical protein [Sunxiuqinia sp.]|tara:strand:- start:11985 stop:12260 length:276 start_codon:yes stop_codon:yes gene_type:complete
MVNFKQINYHKSLELFEHADLAGKRLRLGEFSTSIWLQKENINLDEIKDISKNYPDLKIFIIGEGESEGFYIYSQRHETCFKFEAELSLLK